MNNGSPLHDAKIVEILKAQSELLIHLTERVMLLQVSFEAFLHQQVGESGAKHDEHYALREKMLSADEGTTIALIRTLKKALD